MAQRRNKDGEPWTPKIESNPLFTNSADFERGLGADGKTPDIDIVDEDADEVTEVIPKRSANQ